MCGTSGNNNNDDDQKNVVLRLLRAYSFKKRTRKKEKKAGRSGSAASCQQSFSILMASSELSLPRPLLSYRHSHQALAFFFLLLLLLLRLLSCCAFSVPSQLLHWQVAVINHDTNTCCLFARRRRRLSLECRDDCLPSLSKVNFESISHWIITRKTKCITRARQRARWAIDDVRCAATGFESERRSLANRGISSNNTPFVALFARMSDASDFLYLL